MKPRLLKQYSFWRAVTQSAHVGCVYNNQAFNLLATFDLVTVCITDLAQASLDDPTSDYASQDEDYSNDSDDDTIIPDGIYYSLANPGKLILLNITDD